MEQDKVFHLAAGALVALAAWALIALAPQLGTQPAMAIAAAAVGVAYELVQRLRGEGVPDPADALATAAGGGLVALLVWALA
jgi:hypothetical protein